MILQTPQVQEFLAGHLGLQIEGIELLRGGEWSQAFGFRADGRDLVVRFGRFVEDFRKDQAASRFSSAALPIPEVLQVGSELDHHFCISQRVFGGMIDELDAAGWRRIVPSLLGVMERLGQLEFGGMMAGLDLRTRPWSEQLLAVDEETDRVFGWHDRMAASSIGIGPYQEGLAYLKEHLSACPDARNVVHNDLLHYNVLVADDEIVGVIDWGNAMCGDSLFDLAMFTFYSPWYPAMEGIDWLGEAKRRFDVSDLEQRLLCYEVRIALENMAYSAFKERWPEVEANAARMMARLERGLPGASVS